MAKKGQVGDWLEWKQRDKLLVSSLGHRNGYDTGERSRIDFMDNGSGSKGCLWWARPRGALGLDGHSCCGYNHASNPGLRLSPPFIPRSPQIDNFWRAVGSRSDGGKDALANSGKMAKAPR